MTHEFNEQLSELFFRSRNLITHTPEKRVVIYGAGGFGQKIAEYLQQSDCEILFFIDQHSRSNFAWPIFTPDTVTPPHTDVQLILGIFNPYVDLMPIVEQLRKKGFRNIITPVELFRQISMQNPPPQYWLTTPEQYWQHEEDVIRGVEFFDDQLSRKLYVDLWRYRLWGNQETLPIPSSPDRQYFPTDIPAWQQPLRLVDCGAYTGDTLEFIRGLGMKMDAVAAFEPDPENYVRLVQTMTRLNGLQECTAIPCGVFDDCTQLRFSAGVGGGSSINAQGNVTIQCVSIDQCLPVFAPNLIKMDVEGAEPAALRGAENTIRRHRPGLAISAYHTPHHIWQLPRLIQDWNLGYKFYLRTHLYQGFDTVLYALPG